MTDITPMIDNSGNEYDIPTKELEQFKADMGTGVQRQYLYRTEDGQDFAIPENDAKAFLNDFPNARPVRRIQLLGGETEDIPSNEMSQFFQRYETDDRYKHDREYDAAVKVGEEARKEYAVRKKAAIDAGAKLYELEAKHQWMDDTIEFFKGVGRTFINPEKEYREVLGDDHIATHMIASGNDAANSIVAGVLKIPYGIQKVLGYVAGGRNTSVGNWLIDNAQKTEEWIDYKLPQHTKEKYMSESEAEIGNTIQNMTSTLFNFTLTAGVGGAVGATTKAAGGAVAGQRAANATIVAIDSSDAYIDTYDRAIARGAEPSEANALANQAFIWNAIMEGTLINGGLNPMLNSANKLAATPTIDLTKHTFSGITRGLTVGTLRNYAAKTTGHVLSTAAIMGTDKAGKESIRQVADGEEVDFEKIAEAGKSGLVEGGVMGAVFGSAAGFTAAGEYRACHKAMKKKFGDMIIKNIETARGREMMAAANPKGTYDFLKARENGGVPSRKQADRMILPDTLSGKQRAEIADKFLKDGITPEKIKADMFDRIPKAKSVEPKAEPPKQALPPPASTPETPAEQPVPPVEPPKAAESTAGSAVVKPVEAGASKTTPGAETPSEAVLERSTQAAVQQKTATTPAETPVEEAKTPAKTPVVAENGTQIVENGKETPKPAEETAPEQPVSTAPEAASEAHTPQNAVEAPTSAPTETQPITPPEPAKVATDAPVTPDGASAAKDAPKDAVEPATAPDTDFSVTPQNTGKTVTEQKTASIARLDGLMQTAGELSRKRDEANKARNREALKQTAGLSDERAKLREEIATLNSEFAQSRKSIPPEQMDAAVKKYNNSVAKRNKRIQEIENEIAKIHNETTDNSPLGETTVDLGGGTRIRLEMSEPSIKKVRAAISKSMSSLRIEKKPTVEKVEKAMSSIAAKLDPNESRTKRISIVHREDGVMVATDGRMAFTYADDSIKGDNVIDYPNWRMVIPEDRSLTQSPLKIDLAHLHEKASRAAVCSRGNDEMLERMPYMIVRPNGKKGATVDFIGHGGDGKAIFSTTDNPAGAIHVATVNPEFLLKTVKAAAAAGEKELTLKWENAQRPIVLAGEKCKAVIMPLRNTQTVHSDKPIDSVLGLKELYGSAGPAESAAKASNAAAADIVKKIESLTPEYVNTMMEKTSGGEQKIANDFANTIAKMADKMSDSEIGEVRTAIREALYAKGNPMPPGMKQLLNAAETGFDHAVAGRKPSSKETRARIEQSVGKRLTVDKVEKDDKTRIRSSVKNVTEKLTEAQAAEIADALEAEWKASVEADSAYKVYRRENSFANEKWVKEADAKLKEARRHTLSTMNRHNVDVDTTGDWVLYNNKGEVVATHTAPKNAKAPEVKPQDGGKKELSHDEKVDLATEIIANQVRKDTKDTSLPDSRFRDGAERLVNMIEKKNADGLRDRFNGLNKGSVKAFEAITGIKMPSTQKGQHEIVDRFCGITPDQRAKIEADRVAAHEARVEAERHARALEEGEQIMKETRIRLHDGRVATAQQLLEEGWNVKKVKRGATTNLHLIDPKKSGYVKVKGRAFEYADDFIAKRDAAKAREDFDHDSIVLSGDEVRKSMPGYNRLDWRTHVDKTGFVAPRMEGHFRHLLKTRKGKGNGSVAFLAGGNGSGKSTATKNLIQNFDFIVDSTLGNLDVARKQIKAILDNGQKPSIFYVYRNPVDALNGVIERAESGGHMVSPLSFANSHVKARENVGLLAKEFGDKINVTIIDNSKPDKPFISLEELEKKEKIEHEQLRKQAADRIAEVEARTGLGGRRTGEAGAVKGGSEKAGGEVNAEKSFLPGGVIEARRSLESDNGVPPDGWRYLGSSEGNFAVKLPDEKTLREYIEKNFGPIEGEIEAGVKAGGEIYNVNEILLKMAGAKSEVKPMSETVAETQASDSVTPQKKLDTYREYAKSVVLRKGATIADIQNALLNVPEKIGDVTEADIFFERLKSMIVKEFRADKHAIDLNKKYQSTTDASKRQSIEREFRDHQNKFFQNFLDNRKDDIIKAFDELELKPGDTVSNMAKREAGIPQETIGDIAADVAADVDAAIAAEESGADPSAVAHAPAKPAETVESPRGRGTGTLSQDDPVSRGTGTGKRKIVTPQTFLRRARELFPDVAFRHKGTARMKGWAAGHFEPYYRLIRSKDMNSIGTVAHELGHDIEHLTRYDVLRLPAVKRDLSDLGHHLYGNGPKPPSYIGEGFAEYVRGYICNAPNLSTVAPDLDAWFKGAFKAKHPAIVKKLDELRDMVQTMKEQSAAEAVGGFMRPSTESISRAWHKTLDFFSGENWNDSASIILRGMKKSGIDKIFRWQDDFKKLEASKDLYERRMLADMISDKVENNPYIFATITRGTASQRVMDMARYGTTNLLGNKKTGESLKDVFADFSVAEREAWKKYAIAKHGIENYFKKGMNFGLPREVLEDVVSKYETPKFSLALQRYTDYSHRILHLGVESGLISQETYDKIVNDHPIYVRITRRYADDGAHTRQSGQAINRRTGGFDHILDPIDAALMDQEKFLRACFQAKTLQLIVGAGERAATQNIISSRVNGGPATTNTNPVDPAHNAVGAYWPVEVPNAQEAVKFSAAKLKKGLTDAAKDYSGRTGEDFIPLQEFIDDLATMQDAQGRVAQLTIFRDKPSYGKHNLVSVHVDGKLRTFELPDMKWANMLTDVYDKSDFNFLEKMFGLATAGIRLGATTVNPGFAVRNGIRDSLHSAVMSETGAIPGVSTLYGMGQQLLGSEAAELFRAMGGHMSDLVGITKEQKWNHGGKVALAQNPLQTIGAYSSLDWVLMKPVIKAFSDVLSIPELGPRINEMSAVMAKCRKAGLSENACAILAMSHAKDISIDFQRAGRFMKHINHFIPFSNAMWRGTEQTIRNFGILPSLPHQFEDSNPKRGAKTAIRGLAFITSWAVLLAMLEMSGDDKKKRAAFERSKEEKWNYAYVGDWRIPLPFEVGHIFGALPKAAIYEMNGDEGAIKECLETFGQSLPVKYANPDTAIGSISMLTPWIGLLSNRDYRDRPIVPEHIMENAEKQDWYTQYTTELSKKIGSAVGASPAQLEYLLDSYTGGLYRRVALMAENVDDVSRLQEGRGFSMLDTLRARPQANRLIEDFYKFGVEGKRKFGSGNITLEEYGKLASQNPVKKQLTEKFDEMRAARADKSLPLAEQDRRVREISEEAYEIVRKFNAKDDYRKRGIASAADALTDREASDLDEKKKARLLELLKGVSKNEIVTSLIEYGSELVPIKIRGVETYHQRWSSQNINQRVTRLLMLLQD